MSTPNPEAAAAGTCPVCGATVPTRGPLMATEVVPCPECQSMLVVARLADGLPEFREAPRVEEDWGE